MLLDFGVLLRWKISSEDFKGYENRGGRVKKENQKIGRVF